MIELEKKALERHQIPHNGVIGEMYEGLTQAVLSRGLPTGLGSRELSVTTGFAEDDRGNKSRQLDCIIALDGGEPVPHTRHRIHHINNIIAIIEVKKRLYARDLKDAVENLKSIARLDLQETLDGVVRLQGDAFRRIVGRDVPRRLSELSFHQQAVLHNLAVEASSPVCIVLGYEGYVDEFGLRNAFIKELEQPTVQYGSVAWLPQLLICRNAALLKLNGMPYSAPDDSENWRFYASYRGNPLILLLELVFTRLSYLHGADMKDFYDLKIENLALLMTCRFLDLGGYCVQKLEPILLEAELLDDPERKESREWEPVEIDECQFALLLRLCKEDSVKMDSDFLDFVKSRGHTIDSLLKNLEKHRLVWRDGIDIRFLSNQMACVALPDGKLYAGENKDGNLTRWSESRILRKTKDD